MRIPRLIVYPPVEGILCLGAKHDPGAPWAAMLGTLPLDCNQAVPVMQDGGWNGKMKS